MSDGGTPCSTNWSAVHLTRACNVPGLDTLLDTAVRYPLFMDVDSLIRAFIDCPTAVPLAEGVVLEDFGQGMVFSRRAAVMGVLGAFFGGGFPNGRICVEATVVNGEEAAIAFLFCGRQERVFLGLPATGRTVAVPMIILIHTAGNCIQHMRLYYDAGTILRQLGLTIQGESHVTV